MTTADEAGTAEHPEIDGRCDEVHRDVEFLARPVTGPHTPADQLAEPDFVDPNLIP